MVKDAGVAGDAGYTPQNTAIYTLSMLGASSCFKPSSENGGLPTDEKMTLALIAWVCLAPVLLRVLEDADFFSSTNDVLFISPIIHLHLAAWLIGVAVLSHLIAGRFDGQHDDASQEAQATLLAGFSSCCSWPTGTCCTNPLTAATQRFPSQSPLLASPSPWRFFGARW